MVAPKDLSKQFDKDDYYTHPELYYPVFYEKIAWVFYFHNFSIHSLMSKGFEHFN